MMFPTGAVIWDSTACDIKHGHDGYFATKFSRWRIWREHFCQKKADRDNCFVSRKVSAYVEINPGAPAKEDCPICFLPMPKCLLACISLPDATIMSVPIYEFAALLAEKQTERYYSCCGKSICAGCVHSFSNSGNIMNCPFCKADTFGKTNEEEIEEIMTRVEVNDAYSIYVLGSHYYHGKFGLLQDRERARELWKQAAALGSSKAHYNLGSIYREGGDLKKAKIHYKAASMQVTK